MTVETTFFSYSRTDSAFVMKLANDLRDAGADIWVDVTDIKPGEDWAASIEAALNAAPRMIVLLTPESVASSNVRDEISYALNKRKTVIPLLIKECAIPLRIISLHHIDFTQDYQKGLNQLLKALGNTVSGTPKKKSENKVQEHAPTPVPEQKQGEEIDNELWEEAKKINSIKAYKKYLIESIPGNHTEKARQLIKALEEEQRGKEAEGILWQKTKATKTLSAYNHYLKIYPEGTHKTDALNEISRLNETEELLLSGPQQPANNPGKQSGKRTTSKKYALLAGAAVVIALGIWGLLRSGPGNSDEYKEWNTALSANDSTAYAKYLQKFSNGKYAKQAKDKIDSIAYAKKVDTYVIVTEPKAVIVDSGKIAKTKTEKEQDPVSAVNNSKIAIGQKFQGGIIFYVDETGEHGLIAATADLKQTTWYEAKRECNQYRGGGYNDWYLPNQDELNKLYKKKKVVGGFIDHYYWSSAEKDDSDAYLQYFSGTGGAQVGNKNMEYFVRAIRAF